jgi:hypothetical protein
MPWARCCLQAMDLVNLFYWKYKGPTTQSSITQHQIWFCYFSNVAATDEGSQTPVICQLWLDGLLFRSDMGYIHLMTPVAQIHTISMGPMMVAKYRPKYFICWYWKSKTFLSFCFLQLGNPWCYWLLCRLLHNIKSSHMIPWIKLAHIYFTTKYANKLTVTW